MRMSIPITRRAIQKVKKVIRKNNLQPILNNILLKAEKNQCKLICTDLETTIIETLPLEKPENFSLLLSSRIIQRILDENLGDQDATLLLSIQDKQIEIETLPAKYILPLAGDSNEYPAVPERQVGKETTAQITGRELAALTKIEKTKRPGFSSIHFCHGCVFSTDGHRLYRVQTDCKIEAEMPVAGAAIMSDLMENDQISFAHNHFSHQTETGIAFIRANEGNEGTNLATEIPKLLTGLNKIGIEVEREGFIGALHRISAIMAPKAVLETKDDMVKLSAQSEYGSAEEMFVACFQCPDERSVVFDASYLISALNLLADDFVIIHIGTSTDPIYISGLKDKRIDAAIMPMK